jgi:hypothetical protein
VSYERFQDLVLDLCAVLHHPDTDTVLSTGRVEVRGFEVLLNNFDGDPQAMYLSFNFGVVMAGRTLRVYRLMLESNLSVYAQDQAQLGLDADTGCAHLIVRVAMVDGVDGPWLAETLDHYFEHGRYWKDTIMGASDDMFHGLCSGDFRWIRA